MNTTRDQIEAQSRKDPERPEREIDQQRDMIGEIISALENKLSPGEIVERVMRAGNGNGGDFARNLGNVVRANPMPTLLATAGLAWLYASRRNTAPVDQSSSGYDRDYTTTGTTSTSSTDANRGEGHGSGDSLKDKAAHKASDLKDGIADRASQLHEGASHMRETASEKWSDAKDSVGEKAHHAAGSVRHQAHRARSGFSDLMEDNPLVIGAIALGIGALLGAALPTTRKEDELMGETGDNLRSKAGEAKNTVRDKGREVAQAAREKGKEAVSGIKEGSSGSGAHESAGQAYGASSTTGDSGSTSTQGLGATTTPGSTAGTQRSSI